MNFFENIAYGIYTWDRGRGYSIKDASIHSKITLSLFISSLTLGINGICEFTFRKAIFFNGRFIFHSKIDWAVLLILSFVFSALVTSAKKWESAHSDEKYALIGPVGLGCAIFGAFLLCFIIENSFH